MTDLEIDKALALAIGWKPKDVAFHDGMWCIVVYTGEHWREFSHKDWNVIGPIGARYNKFPYAHRDVKTGLFDGKWVVWPNTLVDTPQRAISMAVIEGTKR